MSGLAGRIAARLDALEAGARGATEGDWKLWGMQVLADQDGTSNADTAVPVASTHFRNEAGKPRTFDADHIAAWDPAAVLRLVDGLRAVVGLGPTTCSGYDDDEQPPDWPMRLKHYPDPDCFGHCDGCAAAEAADDTWRAALLGIAAALGVEVGE